MAVKLQMFDRKTCHSGSDPIRICFFVLCPCLDAPDGTSVDTICRLNMLLVFFFDGCPLLKMQHFLIAIQRGMVDTEPFRGFATSK